MKCYSNIDIVHETGNKSTSCGFFWAINVNEFSRSVPEPAPRPVAQSAPPEELIETDSTPEQSRVPTPEPEPQEAEEAPLPEGWEMTVDFSGRTVYVNHATRMAQFDRPAPEPERYLHM